MICKGGGWAGAREAKEKHKNRNVNTDDIQQLNNYKIFNTKNIKND